MVEQRNLQQTTVGPQAHLVPSGGGGAGVGDIGSGDPRLAYREAITPGTTKLHFQNPQTETAYQGLTGISEGKPPSNEAVIVGIEQAKQSIMSSRNLLSREGRIIQRDTLLLLDLIKMVIEDRNSDGKIQQFLVCFRNLSQKYAPEFGEDLRFGVKRGYASTQKGGGKDIYNAIVGLRDFVFQLIRSADFREAVMEFFQYLQVLAGEVDINAKTGTGGSLLNKFASGIKSFGVNEEEGETKKEEEHSTASTVIQGTGGGSQNLRFKQEESLLPSQVSSEEELKRNQGQLSEPGQFSSGVGGIQQGLQQQPQQQQQWSGGVGQQQFGGMQPTSQVIQGTQFHPSQDPYSQPSTLEAAKIQTTQIPLIPATGLQQTQQPQQQWSGSSGGVSSELKPSSLYGTSHQGVAPLESGQQFSQQQQSGIGSQQGIGGQQEQSELKPSSLYGTSHQGVAPFESSIGGVGSGISGQPQQSEQYGISGVGVRSGGIDDQYRQPSEQSNVQGQEFRPMTSGIGMQQQQPQQQWSSQQQGIPQVPISQQTYGQGLSQPHQPFQSSSIGQSKQHESTQSGVGGDKKLSRREIEDSLIDRYVALNKRFSKDPNYQRALFGLFNIFNQVKSLFGVGGDESGTSGTSGIASTKTVDRMREDEDFTSLLNLAKLILYEFSDRKIFDSWLDSTNNFFVHLKTDERLKGVLRDIMNDFKRYAKEPTLLESQQEKESLRTRLFNFREVLEEKKNMNLTNDMLTYGRELIMTMRRDELNAELRERSQKLMQHLFLDEKGNFQLKPSALDQIRTILFVAIQEAINNWNTVEVEGDDGTQYFKISNITLKANDILPDDVKFKVKNRTSMRYEEIKPTDKLAESATLIGAHLFGMTAHLKDVGFVFDRRSFPSISDRGVMDIDFDRGGISIKLKLKARLTQNRPFIVKGVGVSVDTLHIKFKQAEKHKLMLKMISPILQGRVRRKIHDNLETTLNNNIREWVERLNDLIENAIIQGNTMGGQTEGQGGMLTSLMGRMGINTAGTTGSDIREGSEDWPQEGGEYVASRQATRVVPVTTTRKVTQRD